LNDLTLKIKITGQVQGVGFRPFIYRLAQQYNLTGWVKNCSGEVITLVQGSEKNLQSFQQSILNQHPPLAKPVIESLVELESDLLTQFVIEKSATSERAERHIPPDYFTCTDCLAELSDPQQRRYRYPFINCTQCGPRYTIINDLPYDRPNTSMVNFPLCTDCNKEYSNPMDRRFHAQPLACSECGPELSFIDNNHPSETTKGNNESLTAAVKALEQGLTLAVKGIGGYHLICDATNEKAVLRLRSRKHRPDKPLAVMFAVSGKDGLQQLKHYCAADESESQALSSPQRPIVLVTAKAAIINKPLLAKAINPGLKEIGAMLAYSPLHYLILNDFGRPIVATSGNLSGEPVLTNNKQAELRLANIANAFLQHNRPILRPADDSVVRIINNKQRLLRIGRGISPLEFKLKQNLKSPLLAVGGQMKNTIALAWDNRVVISPHIGELDSKRSIEVFAQVIDDLCHLYRVIPQKIICDAHPNYYSSRYAKTYALEHQIPLIKVQHHRAHASIVSGSFDNIVNRHLSQQIPWLVFTWDGTGLGDDQSIWGGEAFYGQAANWQRICSIKPFYLQGGDKVAKEPWRSACALLWENKGLWENKDEWESIISDINLGQNKPPKTEDISLAFKAWEKRLNTVPSSSMGRLFDAASALLGLGSYSSFEGQGPMLLEALASKAEKDKDAEQDKNSLPLYEEMDKDQNKLIIADWSELLTKLLDNSLSRQQQARYFHHTIAETLITQAKKIQTIKGNFRVGLSGGVFQNKYLSEYLFKRLAEENFQAFLPDNIPYNDAGLAFGQIIEGMNK
jgi:hydrogenase maturation protein HypF